MIKLQQTWYHFFDKAKENSGSRNIHQVADFFTDEQFIYLDMVNSEFSELRIFGRNLNREIGFIEKNGIIIVNLGNLKEFPLAEGPHPLPLHHVKIQINYIKRNESFKVFKGFKTGYRTSFSLKGKLQPEFTLNIPNGMSMKKEKGNLLRAYFYKMIEIELGLLKNNSFQPSYNIYKQKEWKEKVVTSIKIDKIFYLKIVTIFSKFDEIKENLLIFGINLSVDILSFDKPHVSHKTDNVSYTFIIDKKSYNRIIETPKFCLTSLDFGYTTTNELTFFLFPYVAILLAIFVLLTVVYGDFSMANTSHSSQFNMAIPISLLIVTLSYLGLYYEFSIVKKYEIPYKTIINCTIPLIFLLTLLVFLFGSFPNLKPQIQTIWETWQNYLYMIGTELINRLF